MFSGFMINTWTAATIIAVIAGVVGFFVVLRGAAFPAHAIPNGAFAGAAGANLLGVDPILGLTTFSVLAAFGIGILGRRGRHDVATALALVVMLALGALFLSRSTEYEPEIYALLFGDILGVSRGELLPVAGLAAASIAAVLMLFRPLLLASVVPDLAEARGIRTDRMEMAFLVVLGLATALTVPVVGALLIFSLMIGPPAAARAFIRRPVPAMAASVGVALIVVWAAIACSYRSDWPVGFFVGTFSALVFAVGRVRSARSRRGVGGPAPSLPGQRPVPATPSG